MEQRDWTPTIFAFAAFFIGLATGLALGTYRQPVVTLDTQKLRGDLLTECFKYTTDNTLLLNDVGRQMREKIDAYGEQLRIVNAKLASCPPTPIAPNLSR